VLSVGGSSFLPLSPTRESATWVWMHLVLPESGRMGSGRIDKNGLSGGRRLVDLKTKWASVYTSTSDSIGASFLVPHFPVGEGRRQPQQAGLRGASIPCLRTPFNERYLSLWNQPVAAMSEDRLRQLKLSFACPDGAGVAVVTLSRLLVPPSNSVLPGSLHTENALLKANAEV
jgi:hypothetical protein